MRDSVRRLGVPGVAAALLATMVGFTTQAVILPQVASASPAVAPPTPHPGHAPSPDTRDVFQPTGPLPTSPSLPGGPWLPLGPAAIGPSYLSGGGFYGGVNSGRIDGLTVIPSGGKAGRVVASTAGGGIWTSDNGGVAWTPRTDQAPSLAVGAVTIDPSNVSHLIAGMGEANQCSDCYPGYGILSSSDGGDTWSVQDPGKIFDNLHVAKVAIDQSNSSHMFAATDGGLFVTTDGGTSWAKPTDASYATVDGNVTGVVVDPTNPQNVYIGGGSKTVARSTDGGGTWSARNTGITAPGGGAPFTAVAISQTNPAELFASVGDQTSGSLYKTIDGGGAWTKVATAPDYFGQGFSYGSGTGQQGWYDNVVAIDPANASHVLAGGIALVESTDGGTTWTNVNAQGFFGGGTNLIHPDQHALAFRPDGKVWIGDDGGVFLYDPAGPTVTNANGNLNITQFYSGFNTVSGTLLAGAQDNSTARTSSGSLSAWTGIQGGDGGPSAITTNHTQTQFMQADQILFFSGDSLGTLNKITPPPLVSGSNINAPFTVPILDIPSTATPSDPTVFYGGPDVYRTTNPSNATPTWTKVTTVANFVSAFVVSPSNPQVVYVGFENGTIQVSTDGGQTFTSLAAHPFTDKWVTGISVDPTNDKKITVSVSSGNVRQFQDNPHVAQYVYTATPGTGTWTTITGNLPTGGVNRVVYSNGSLVAATDTGVYGTANVAGASTHWITIGTGLPSVQVEDLDVESDALYIVTHGRGAWKILPSVSDMGVTKTGPQQILAGQTGSYTVRVENNGPNAALNAQFVDAVPSGLTFVSETQTSGPVFTCSNPPVGGTGNTQCSIASLANGGVATFQLVYALGPTSCITTATNTATVSSSTLDTNATNDVATVVTPVTSLCFWALVGQTSQAQTGIYVNQTTAIQHISSLTTSDNNFSIPVDSCSGHALAPGASCRFQVVFHPTHVGQQNALLTVGGTPGPVTLPLTGNSTTPSPQAPAATLSATTLTFSTHTGTTAPTQTLIITNTGGSILDFGSITTTGDPAFSVVSNTCTGGHFAPGASCRVQVAFHAAHSGLVTGQLVIVDDAPDTPQNVTLNGTGT